VILKKTFAVFAQQIPIVETQKMGFCLTVPPKNNTLREVLLQE
jgi:hypothetical protein